MTTLTTPEAMNTLRNPHGSPLPTRNRVMAFPVNIQETDGEIIVEAELPGLDREQIDITFENRTLLIRGERPATVSNTERSYRERWTGRFERSFQVRMPVDVENIRATYRDGILAVTLPKAAEVRPRSIAITTDAPAGS